MLRLTRLLSKKESYSSEDLPAALRIGSTLWAMGMAIAILLLPLSPPDEAIGAAGWAVTTVLVAAGSAPGSPTAPRACPGPSTGSTSRVSQRSSRSA